MHAQQPATTRRLSQQTSSSICSRPPVPTSCPTLSSPCRATSHGARSICSPQRSTSASYSFGSLTSRALRCSGQTSSVLSQHSRACGQISPLQIKRYACCRRSLRCTTMVRCARSTKSSATAVFRSFVGSHSRVMTRASRVAPGREIRHSSPGAVRSRRPTLAPDVRSTRCKCRYKISEGNSSNRRRIHKTHLRKPCGARRLVSMETRGTCSCMTRTHVLSDKYHSSFIYFHILSAGFVTCFVLLVYWLIVSLD